jgi:drug/metabolite transporter (DMT)-like permease
MRYWWVNQNQTYRHEVEGGCLWSPKRVVIAAIAVGFYSYFQRLASPNVNQLFGALVVSAVAPFTNPVGMWFLLGAGAAAFSIDYFTLQAYSRGLPISVGAPAGIAGGVATAVVIGLLLGEQLSFAKLAGIVLVVTGGIVLVAYK